MSNKCRKAIFSIKLKFKLVYLYMFKIYNQYYIIFCSYMYVLKLSYALKLIYIYYIHFLIFYVMKKTNLNLANLKEISILTKID